MPVACSGRQGCTAVLRERAVGIHCDKELRRRLTRHSLHTLRSRRACRVAPVARVAPCAPAGPLSPLLPLSADRAVLLRSFSATAGERRSGLMASTTRTAERRPKLEVMPFALAR
jgi:hypothetical protein